MSGNGYVLQKSAELNEQALAEINRYTRREFSAEELYTFSVVLCDNEIDRDYECFTEEALQKLCALFLGRTGIFNHNPQAENQTARIFHCEVEHVAGKVTKKGEPYSRLVAQAYLPRGEKNAAFILELESGMKKEVSVGCAVGRVTCSVCGADLRTGVCEHRKGISYNGAVCHAVLEEPTDAYEWSFVAVPAQREAGVIKSCGGEFTAQGELEELRRLAEFGKQYRTQLENRVVKYVAIAQPEIPAETMRRTAQQMSAEDLQAFEQAFRKQAEAVLPLAPQLASVQEESPQCNQEYCLL